MAGSEFTGETSEGSRKKAVQKHSTFGLEAVEAEGIVEKDDRYCRQEEKRGSTGRNPIDDTGAQN